MFSFLIVIFEHFKMLAIVHSGPKGNKMDRSYYWMVLLMLTGLSRARSLVPYVAYIWTIFFITWH